MNTQQIESVDQESTEEESIEEESIEQENTLEGFTNKRKEQFNTTAHQIKEINKRLTAIEARLNSSSSNNVHDIILYIIIGVFILFALDSIFRIGRGTV